MPHDLLVGILEVLHAIGRQLLAVTTAVELLGQDGIEEHAERNKLHQVARKPIVDRRNKHRQVVQLVWHLTLRQILRLYAPYLCLVSYKVTPLLQDELVPLDDHEYLLAFVARPADVLVMLVKALVHINRCRLLPEVLLQHFVVFLVCLSFLKDLVHFVLQILK